MAVGGKGIRTVWLLDERGTTNWTPVTVTPCRTVCSRFRGCGRSRSTTRVKPRDTATRDELYARARDRGVAGRSAMTKKELLRALRD
ncbi:hypothetical protein GCM10010112_59740 [Actinoplanes lobatus]|nr:hypothetical protein GCM10010112_59740 [Actinoplanes lobatus]